MVMRSRSPAPPCAPLLGVALGLALCFAPAAAARGASDGPALRGAERPPLTQPKIPCQCRHKGGRAQLGEEVCLRRSGRSVWARCEMILNNTGWRELRDGCDAPSS